jgi:hypothetical protein
MGECADDAAALTFIQACKWDSVGDGTGTPRNGMWYYRTGDHKLRVYKNGAWADLDTTGGSGGFPPWSKFITVDKTDADADYSTINAAVSAASNGDTIVIGPGDYAEQINMTKHLRLIGAGRRVNASQLGGVTRIRPTISTEALDAIESGSGIYFELWNLEVEPIITNPTDGGQNSAVMVSVGSHARIVNCYLAIEPATGAANNLSLRALVLLNDSNIDVQHSYLTVNDPSSICPGGDLTAVRHSGTGLMVLGGGTRIMNGSGTGKGRIDVNDASADLELNEVTVEDELDVTAAGSVKISGGARIGTYAGIYTNVTNTSEAGKLRMGTSVYPLGEIKDGQAITRNGTNLVGVHFDGTTTKRSVRAATIAALPACTPSGSGVGKTLTADANGALIVDGVTMDEGDRLLVKNQATGSDNGIYDVTQAGSGGSVWILTRSDDYDGTPAGEVGPGGIQNVQEGTVNEGTIWELATNGAITIDTTALSYERANQKNMVSPTFNQEFDNGNSGTADTINWNNGLKQKSTLTDNCTFTFTDPPGPCNMILKLIQDGTGGRTVTWPASVKWPGGTAPTLSAGGDDIDIVALYFDGTNYFGVASLDFS